MERIARWSARATTAAAILALAATGAVGQRTGTIPVDANGEPLPPPMRGTASPFDLAASADFARTWVNPGDRVEYCVENLPNAQECPQGFYVRDDGVGTISYRGGASWIWGVPASEWQKARQKVPSLANIKGNGYTVMNRVYTGIIGSQILPKDGSLGTLHNNITRAAGGCAASYSWLEPDILLPTSSCPPTWGPAGWLGAQEITKEQWLAEFRRNPNAFTFDFWRIPGAYAKGTFDPERNLGSNLAYGVSSDWSLDKAQAYGNVVPVSGVNAPPQDPGWPLGLDVRVDAFKFDVPTLRQIVFYQVLIINRSKEVYGVGLDYDSLYIGFNNGAWFHSGFQNAGAYIDVAKGAYKSTISGIIKNPPCWGKPQITDITCGGRPHPLPIGDQHGAHAIVVLKSPIGDLRNKLFTRGDPQTNPFYNPNHPKRGDTITFNHFHMCGFRQCNQTTYQRIGPDPDGMQRAFGMLSSTEVNVLGARALSTLSDATFWHTFRSEVFPDRSRGFNKWDPPGWNNSFGFRTLYLDTCGRKGCVAAWNDTLPNDVPGGPGFINAYNNTGQIISVGPIRLAAGDTTGWILAYATSVNSKDEVDAMIDRIINTYMNFFLAPKPAPPPQIRAITVDPAPDPRNRSVTLFLSLEPLKWVDPFLESQAANYATGDAKALNPTLEQALRDRARNNVRAIHIFKSCDNGATYTVSADCSPAPAPDGRFGGLGWRPAFTFEVDKGPIPTRVVDRNVTPGRTYLYVAVAETRGAQFVVLSRTPSGQVVGENVEFAPPLFNSLGNNVDLPNIERVRLPASLAAGAELARAAFTSQLGPARVEPEGFEPLTVALVGTRQPGGEYRILFADSARVLVSDGGGPTQVTIYRRGTPQDFTSTDPVTLNGLTAGSPSGGRTPYTSRTLTAVLLGPGGAPLLVTAQLTGENATPGEFVASPRFPGFFLSIAHRPGQFAEQFYTATTGAETERLRAEASPSIVWSTAAALARTGKGEYVIKWEAPAFGPGAPFAPNFANPTATEQAVAASLAARRVAATTVIPTPTQVAQIAAALRATRTRADSALALRVEAGEFQQAKLPFTVRNVTAGRDVQVAMLRRGSNVRTLTTSEGSVRITVPADVWLPGDTLFFIENNEVTWARVVLECGPNAPPAPCNPVPPEPIRTTTPAIFASPTERHALHVRYYVGFDATSEFVLQVTAPRVAGLAAEKVRDALANVRVVPNPYLVTSLTDDGPTRRIMFTGLPASGRIRIFSLSGQFLQELRWNEGDLSRPGAGAQLSAQGDLYYNLRTLEGNLLASGLYLYVVEALDADGKVIGRKQGKFVIVQGR